jgi:type IV secretion system protein VirB3
MGAFNMSQDRNQGITLDPLFVGATRPAMALGVTYSALLINFVVTAEMFLMTKNLLWLLGCVPIHGMFWLVCKNEPRFFDLLALWGKTRGPGLFANVRFWKANSYSPLRFDLPNRQGKRLWVWADVMAQSGSLSTPVMASRRDRTLLPDSGLVDPC